MQMQILGTLPSSSSSLKNSSLSFAECDFFISPILFLGTLRRSEGEKNEGLFLSGVGGVLNDVTCRKQMCFLTSFRHFFVTTVSKSSSCIPTLYTTKIKKNHAHSLMKGGILIFLCPAGRRVSGGHPTDGHLSVTFALRTLHPHKLHVVVLVEAERHTLSHLSCYANL